MILKNGFSSVFKIKYLNKKKNNLLQKYCTFFFSFSLVGSIEIQTKTGEGCNFWKN